MHHLTILTTPGLTPPPAQPACHIKGVSRPWKRCKCFYYIKSIKRSTLTVCRAKYQRVDRRNNKKYLSRLPPLARAPPPGKDASNQPSHTTTQDTPICHQCQQGNSNANPPLGYRGLFSTNDHAVGFALNKQRDFVITGTGLVPIY